MFKAKDGKKFGSAFRMRRYDSAHEGHEPGPRAEAHEINEPKEEPTEEMGEPKMGEGDHSEIQQIAAEHGPAHEVHITHDHAAGKHHVHSVHEDGHEHHADHPTADHAHMHAAHAAGLKPNDGEYPMEHEVPRKDEDDFEGSSLDEG